ncbi:MAG: hypothetical protein U0586_17420 [Candidatus Brocadiaceae bacterium]
MLSDELRNKLIEKIKTDPKAAIAELEKEPKLLEFLLNSSQQLENEKREKIKYVNMTSQMRTELEEKSKELKISQGLLIGGGVLLMLALLSRKK